jgi:hypothetical protein
MKKTQKAPRVSTKLVNQKTTIAGAPVIKEAFSFKRMTDEIISLIAQIKEDTKYTMLDFFKQRRNALKDQGLDINEGEGKNDFWMFYRVLSDLVNEKLEARAKIRVANNKVTFREDKERFEAMVRSAKELKGLQAVNNELDSFVEGLRAKEKPEYFPAEYSSEIRKLITERIKFLLVG